MFRVKSIDLVREPLLPAIIKYSLPVILASLIQVLFNTADLAVLGRFDSEATGVAAVGATGAIVGLLVNSVIGLSGGTNILLARSIGAGDEPRSRRIVGSSIIMSLGVGIIVLAAGMILSPWFLEITNCPSDCFDGAKTYLYIYFAAAPAIFIYNFGSAIIRVSGDSQRPLYYMVAAGVVNLILNFVLCFVLPNKVAAVGIATLVSQLLGAALVTVHLLRISGPCRVEIKNLMFSWRELGTIMRVGLPGAFNGALYSISNLQIQSAINCFGSAATAGNSASAQLEGFVNSFTNAFGVSSLALVGQNIGAGRRARVKRSILWCGVFGFAIGAVFGWGLLLAGEYSLRVFIPTNSLAVEFGFVRMSCILSMYWVVGINTVLGSAIQAFGYPSLPMINSVVTVLLFRIFWMNLIYPNMTVTGDPVSDIFNIFFCYPWSWGLSMLINAVIFAIVYVRYRRGRLKSL